MTFLLETIQASNETEIHRFYRDNFGKKHKEIIRGFRPYFYVDNDVIVPDDYRITSVETGHKSLLNEKVKKIFVQRSKDIVGVRSLFEKHYEADVLFTQRYIVDVLGETEIYKLHILSIDIETDTKHTFPNIEDPDQSITSCAFADNNGIKRKYIYKSPECVEDINMDENTRVFKTEEQLLEAIIGFIKSNDPDVITGWSIFGFDLPYLINRMKKLKVRYSGLSPLDMVFCKKNEHTEHDYDVAIKGRILMDGMEAYIHFRKMSNQGRAENYSLEFTAQSVLGVGKLKHEEGFHDMWVNHPNKLIEYNLRDAELVIKILEKLEIIDFFNYIRTKSFANLSQIYRTTTLVDGYLLRKSHNKWVLPSKNKQNVDKYKGAFVFSPTPGLYENVIALDLKALYPNIIKTFNISFETFNPNGEIQLKEGIGFDRGIGLFSQVMRELEKERAIYKKLMWQADIDGDKEKHKLNNYKQYAVKVLANSVYGYSGHSGSRLYKREVAEAITEWGVRIIKWSQEVLESAGYEIAYADTDSLYVKSKNTKLFSLLKEGKKLTKILNDSYTKFCEDFGSIDCTLEMEFEKIFKKVLFVGKKGEKNGKIVGAKKKYAYILLWEDKKQVDNSVKFTGFEFARSDSCRVTRKTQHDIVEMILNGITKEELTAKLRDIDAKIRGKKISTEDIAFPKGISKSLSEYGKRKLDEETGKWRNTGTPPVITGARYCYDEKTEVLTDEGWKFFKNLTGNEEIATLKDGKYLEYEKPIEIIVDDYKGKMYNIDGKQIDLCVTPNHNLYRASTWINKHNNHTWTLTKAIDNLHHVSLFKKDFKWIGKEVEDYIIPEMTNKWCGKNSKIANCKYVWKEQKIDMDIWLEFLGYYISEGSARGTKGGKGIKEISISQYEDVNPEKFKKIEKCLLKLPYKFCKIRCYNKNTGFKTKNRQLWTLLRKLGNSSEKYIYREFLELSTRQLTILYDAMFLGDGYTTNFNTPVYTTISKKLADNVQEMLLKMECVANVLEYTCNNKPLYHICKINPAYSIINYKQSKNSKSHDKLIDYTGKIYCVNVPNHIIYVRRNGKGVWCGNSNNYLGTRFGKGSKPKWIYIKTVPYGYPNTKVLSFDGEDIPKGFIIDYDIMIEKILKLKLEEILLASGFGSFPSTDVRQQTI